jgi:hypothetical protein
MNTRVIPKVSVRLRFFAIMAIIVFSMVSCDNGSNYEGAESVGNNDNSDLVTDESPQTPQIPPPVQVNQTPVAGDFTISGTGTFTYNGSPRPVTVTPKPGKSTGAITVKYNGNTTTPSAAGAYTVTFDVAEATGFNPASGLNAGTLTIKAASGGGGGGGGGSSSGGGNNGGGTTPQVLDPQSFNVVFSGPTDKVIPVTSTITNDLSISNGGTIMLDISESFTNYEWFVGGSKVAAGNNVTLQADNPAFIPGNNWITAVVYDGTGANAIPWSGAFVVVVNN